jgi:hypothetical protein
MPKIRNKYFQKRNCATPDPISTSCVCERFIYSHNRSAYSQYSAAGKYVDRSWDNINRSQTHIMWKLVLDAAQFLFWEYINGIFIAVYSVHLVNLVLGEGLGELGHLGLGDVPVLVLVVQLEGHLRLVLLLHGRPAARVRPLKGQSHETF